MSTLLSRIQHAATDIHAEIIGYRRYLHAHPELSYQEVQTAQYVADKLTEWGVPFEPNIGGYGLVATLAGTAAPDGPTVALRADMDALPILEENEVPYKSLRTGVMHACGHDAHTASLLGTVRILHQLQDQLPGTVRCIFQPAEEKAPGGASLMIKEGVLAKPGVEAIFGQHVMPYFETGKIGVRSGMYMASADEIYLLVKGKGGHAAHPHTLIDPVLITAQILTTLQQVVSRSDPRIPTVLSFGKIIAEGATNIIPDEVHVEGTLRTLDEAWRKEAKEKIKQIAHHTAQALGGSVDIDIVHGYPMLYNDESLTQRARNHIADYVGEENVIDMDLWMAAEDFAYYTHEVPGCFYRLGTRNESRGIIHGLHTPLFDIDEQALSLSTGLMAWLAIKELESKAS